MGKWIPGLYSPHREPSLEPLHVPCELFSRSLLHNFTLGPIFEPLTSLYVCLSYRYPIATWIYGLDSPYREHSFGVLNVPFAPFSRFFLHNLTLG